MSSAEFLLLVSRLHTFHAEGRLNSEESLATMREYGAKIFRMGKLDEAEIIFGDCISRSVFHFGTTFEGSMVAMTKLCEVYSAAKRHVESERVYFLFYEKLAAEIMHKFAHDLLKVQEVTELWKKYGREKEVNILADFHHNLQMSASNADPVLAVKASHQLAVSKGSDMTFVDFEKVQALFSSCLNQAKSVLGSDNEQIFRIRFDQAVFLEERGTKYVEAQILYLELFEERKLLQNPVDSLFLMVALQRGKLMFTLGHYTNAVDLLKKVLADIAEYPNKETQSSESKALEKKIKIQLAFIQETLGRSDDAVALLEHVDFSNQQDDLEGLLTNFTCLRINDGILPVPIIDSTRSTLYEELHRSFRGKLGVEIANIQGTWSPSRLPFMRALAQLSSRLTKHASEAIFLFDALIRNATRVYGKEHPFTVSVMIDAMEFHIFRLHTKDLPLMSALANDVLQISTNFAKNSEVNRNHMFPKIAQFVVWMCAKTVTKEDVTKMMEFWETNYPARKIEISRLNILLSKIVANGQVSEAESFIRQQIANAPRTYRTYITVLGEKALLEVMLNRLATTKATGSLAREETATLYRQIIGLYRHLYGASYPMALTLTNEASIFFEEADMHDLSEALLLETKSLLQEELKDTDSSEVKARLTAATKTIQDRLDIIFSTSHVGSIYQRAEKNRQDKNYSLAEPLYYTVIRRRTRTLEADAYETLVARNSLAVMLWNIRRLDEAQVILEDCLAIRRGTSGDSDPFTLRIMFNLSNIYKYQGRVDKAEACYTECVKGRRAVLGDNQKETLNAMYYLGLAIAAQHRYRDAHPVLQECKTLRIAAFGQNSATVNEVVSAMQAYTNHATTQLMLRSGEQAAAKPFQDHSASAHYYAEALFLYKLAYLGGVPETNVSVPLMMHNIGTAQRRAFQLYQAEMTLKESLALFEKSSGLVHDKSLKTRRQLAETILLQNRSAAEVIALYEPLFGSMRVVDDKRSFARVAFDLGDVLLNCFHLVEARKWLQDALQVATSCTGFDEPATTAGGNDDILSFVDIAMVEEKLAILESSLSNPDEAIFRQAMDLRRQNCEEEAQWKLHRSLSNVAVLQTRLNEACPLSTVECKSFRLTWVMPDQEYAEAVVYVPTPSMERPKDIVSSEYNAIRMLPKFCLFQPLNGEETNTDALLGFAGERSPLAAIAHLPVLPTSNNNNARSTPTPASAPSAAASTSASFSFGPPPTISSTNNPPVPSGFGGASFGNSNNSSGGLFGNSNSGGGGGLFSNSNNNNNSGGGLFSSSNNNNNSGGGLFSSSNNNNNSGGGLFSSSNNNVGGGGGLFGGGGTSTGSSLFGNNNSGSSFGAAASSAAPFQAPREGSGGLFGSNNTQPSPSFTSSVNSSFNPSFGGPPQQTIPIPQQGFGGVPQPATPQQVFGAPPQPAFGMPSQPAFGAPAQSAFGFGARPAQPSAPSFGGFSFGSASAAPAPTPTPTPTAQTSAPQPTPTVARRIVRSSRNRR